MARHIKISARNAEFQIIEALKNNRTKRSQAGEVFVEGIESIKQAWSAGLALTRIVYARGRRLSSWAQDLVREHADACLVEMEDDLYRELCDRDDPSELLVTAALPRRGLGDLTLGPRPLVVISDRPSDRGNFGTLVRSANAFGVDAVLVLGHGIDPWDPKVIRSSLGAVFHTPILAVESLEELDAWLGPRRAAGMAVVGTDSAGAVPLGEAGLRRPVAVVMGNEARGMSRSLQERCDRLVAIPLGGQVNSLNVACAASIILHEIVRTPAL